MSIFEFVLDELLELGSPLLALIWAKARRVACFVSSGLRMTRPFALAWVLVVNGEEVSGALFGVRNAGHVIIKEVIGVLLWLLVQLVIGRGRAILSQEAHIIH